MICIFVYELCRCLSVVSACMWRKCGSVVCLYLWLDYIVFVYVSESLCACGINVCVYLSFHCIVSVCTCCACVVHVSVV